MSNPEQALRIPGIDGHEPRMHGTPEQVRESLDRHQAGSEARLVEEFERLRGRRAEQTGERQS